MKLNVNLTQFVILLSLVYIFYRYKNSEWANLKCVVAEKNGKRYCIREREDNMEEAVNLLASVVERMKKLVKHMEKKYPNDERVKRLVKNFNPRKISETLPTSEFTAYSENKGEKLAFCLNKHNENNRKLIDINTLTFVSIHELSHVMTISIGHTPEFWENMKFLLEDAVEIDIYKPIDYSKESGHYCGEDITNNPLYDE